MAEPIDPSLKPEVGDEMAQSLGKINQLLWLMADMMASQPAPVQRERTGH